MFSLTLREQFLVIGIITAAVVGSAVHRWRDARREVPVPVAPPAGTSAAYVEKAGAPKTGRSSGKASLPAQQQQQQRRP